MTAAGAAATEALQALGRDYREILGSYLAGDGEDALYRAYCLGREALAAGLRLLDLGALHREALEAELGGAETLEAAVALQQRAVELWANAVSAYELANGKLAPAIRRQAAAALADAKQEAKAARKARIEFLATVSHDFRTPLNGVLGMVDLLTTTELTAEQRDYVETIRQSGEQLLTLVNEVLDLARIEVGAPPLGPLPLDPGQAVASLHILVVDDNPINQKVAGRMLEKLGCRVEVASDGLEALEALGSSSFDLVFMDVQMPTLDGYRATAEIRQLDDPAVARIPIVALTANAIPGDREKCLAAGMDDYLSKPVSRQSLERALARWL